jgi:ABC-type uncharacterized transport system ATPase subunit
MNGKLAKILVARGVIRQGTILEAYQSTKGLSCGYDSYALARYVVVAATTSGDEVFFTVVSSATDQQRIRSDFVKAIDGMAIQRVVAAHQLTMDGTPPERRKQNNDNVVAAS